MEPRPLIVGRAAQRAGLQEGEGAARRRRLRGAAPDRARPGGRRRPRPRRLDGAQRAGRRGGADADPREAPRPVGRGAGDDRLDRAGRARERAQGLPRPRHRQLGQPREGGREDPPRPAAREAVRRRGRRAHHRREGDGPDGGAEGRDRPAHRRGRRASTASPPTASPSTPSPSRSRPAAPSTATARSRRSRGSGGSRRSTPASTRSSGVSNVSFGLSKSAREVINSAFLYHAVQAGLDLAIVNPKDIRPYPAHRGGGADPRRGPALRPARGRARARSSPTSARRGTSKPAAPVEDLLAGKTAEERLALQILHRRPEGIEPLVDEALTRRSAVAVLNEVLLPAMKDVGDRFGAGELILPFVLQSAEVMKRAVGYLEQFLEKKAGSTKGTVVLATVYGDVHDIGKNLVKTILQNNGFTVHDLGKQVPVSTIIERAVADERRRHRPLGAPRLHLEADAGLRRGAAPAEPLLPGDRRRRRHQPALRREDALRRGRHPVRRRRLLRARRLRGPRRSWTRSSTRSGATR